MSREIKFRAWDIQQNRMLEWNELKNEVAILTEALENRYPYFKPIMQFTGLEDKNGMEIYEGDIIREQRKRFKDRYFVVEWLDRIGSYSFQPVDKEAKSWPCFNFGSAKNLEIVGNIYRNKELLEGK